MTPYHKITLKAPQPNFLSEGVRLGLDKEIRLDGTYMAYFPFSRMIERSQMRPYNRKLLHAATDKITITITIIDLSYIREELVLCNPCQWECSLLARV